VRDADVLTDGDLERMSLVPTVEDEPVCWPECGCSPLAYDGASTTIVHSLWCGTPEILLTPEEYRAWVQARHHPAKGTHEPLSFVPDHGEDWGTPEGRAAYEAYWSDGA
jgi:hypothetical protein